MSTDADDNAEIQRLRQVLGQQQEFAWHSLWISVRRDLHFHPDSSGHALVALLHLLEHDAPIDIGRMDVELLSSGVYEAVMHRAAMAPDPRVRDQGFRESVSRGFDLDPGKTLWDSASHFAEVVGDVRTFDSFGPRIDRPNLPDASA